MIARNIKPHESLRAPFADDLPFRLAAYISKTGLSSGFVFAKVEEQSLIENRYTDAIIYTIAKQYNCLMSSELNALFK